MGCSDLGYKTPTIIPGLDFTPEEVSDARRNNKLLSMDIEITGACNAACKYCYRYETEGPQPVEPNELSLGELLDVIRLAHDEHGLRRLCILGGEPLLPGIRTKYLRTIGLCNELGIRHVTFTNGLNVTKDTAQELHDQGASVCVKLNGLTADVHDRLVGVSGAFEKVMNAFDFLMECGYGNGNNGSHIAFATVITQDNYEQIETMWQWARERGILPYVEKMTVQGRGAKHVEELSVSNEMLRAKFERLNEIDRRDFGLDWDVTPPIAGGYHCVRFYISLYVRADGIVWPCVGANINVGNLRHETISEILASPLVQLTRNIGDHVKGKCRSCDLRESCYGCRGAAYQAGDLFGEDPVCWRGSDVPC